MGKGYALAYRLGITPWEQAAEGGAAQLDALVDREEAARTPPFGRALDLGCGTGAHTIMLARRGWQATGIDDQRRAVDEARRREDAHAATFVVGDGTALDAALVGPGELEFVLDLGCFHGLRDHERGLVGAGVTALASPTASMLLLAFRPGRRLGLPRGADETDLAAAFPAWRIDSVEDADTTGMPGPLRGTRPRWFRLVHCPSGPSV